MLQSGGAVGINIGHGPQMDSLHFCLLAYVLLRGTVSDTLEKYFFYKMSTP